MLRINTEAQLSWLKSRGGSGISANASLYKANFQSFSRQWNASPSPLPGHLSQWIVFLQLGVNTSANELPSCNYRSALRPINSLLTITRQGLSHWIALLLRLAIAVSQWNLFFIRRATWGPWNVFWALLGPRLGQLKPCFYAVFFPIQSGVSFQRFDQWKRLFQFKLPMALAASSFIVGKSDCKRQLQGGKMQWRVDFQFFWEWGVHDLVFDGFVLMWLLAWSFIHLFMNIYFFKY